MLVLQTYSVEALSRTVLANVKMEQAQVLLCKRGYLNYIEKEDNKTEKVTGEQDHSYAVGNSTNYHYGWL